MSRGAFAGETRLCMGSAPTSARVAGYGETRPLRGLATYARFAVYGDAKGGVKTAAALLKVQHIAKGDVRPLP